MSILDDIFAHKRQELAHRLSLEAGDLSAPASQLELMQSAARRAVPSLDFRAPLCSKDNHPALIAEIKAASPSRGVISRDFDPQILSDVYAANGAAAVSVLTDARFFGGSLDHLVQVRQRHPALPLLRKDFIFHPYQVYEARTAGADAILLIAAMLDDSTLAELQHLAVELGMSVLFETHNQAEVARSLALGANLVGVNNRDLHTFQVDLETSVRLRPFIPSGVTMIAESGVTTLEDVLRLGAAGVDAVLVGEALSGATAGERARRVRQFSGRQPL